MHFEVIPIYSQGIRRDWKTLNGLQRIRADIHIRTDKFGPLGRESLCAEIFSAPRVQHGAEAPPTLPTLYDVRIEGMATLAFVIEGVEFVDGRMYQQAWHCKESDEKVQVPWTLCPRSTLNELI
ncbi:MULTISPECIES: hypothetical protein [unclassified Pseudomonas]|uniref:hypothetical protein n=1 Tax=unclassified Pseudomonas TaxID=196821 RepID=UPI00244C60BF|nr:MULTISPECIES: hypothetical protein [unclassified Pseudomonas]MDG9927458.1 hypothetical protein [Pseudomonas sp. GD04042]MDH0482527.1 hypothetical protein [Pseudomonas sp. GD04015]MDH0602879.1 hypothetical protein [Pseudomonas sp. GD03869]